MRNKTPTQFSGIVPEKDGYFLDTWNEWKERDKFEYLFWLEKESINRGFWLGILCGCVMGFVLGIVVFLIYK